MSFFSALKSHAAKTGLTRTRHGIKFGGVLKNLLMPHKMLGNLMPHKHLMHAAMDKFHAPGFLKDML